MKPKDTRIPAYIDDHLVGDEILKMRIQRSAVKALHRLGLTDKGWTFAWCMNKGIYGRCRPITRTVFISSSDKLVLPRALNTLRHELAHAYIDEHYGLNLPIHGPLWQACAIHFGVTRQSHKTLRKLPESLWNDSLFNRLGNLSRNEILTSTQKTKEMSAWESMSSFSTNVA